MPPLQLASKIIPIPAFNDNYIWLYHNNLTKEAWVVDPGDAEPVINALEQYQLKLAGILLTHHHADHSGGILELTRHYKGITVIGSHHSAIPFITHHVKESDTVSCSPFTFSVFEIPGHTLDHIAFYNNEVLFCGDTLFSIGCGKIFEGTPEQMYQSLNKLMQLPDNTNMYCGHEYTLANLYFAQHVEPNNSLISDKIVAIKEYLKTNNASLPSTLLTEKQLNPFLRCHQPSIINAVRHHFNKDLNSPIEVFALLREWKNNLPLALV
jgi:hydroxyacylglutathione hydrolase